MENFLSNLPSQGFFSSSPTIPSSNFGSMRVYICDHDTSPPQSQLIKTDNVNILIRSLLLKNPNQRTDNSKSKGVKGRAQSAGACRKRAAEKEGEGGGKLKTVKADSSGACEKRAPEGLGEESIGACGKRSDEIALDVVEAQLKKSKNVKGESSGACGSRAVEKAGDLGEGDVKLRDVKGSGACGTRAAEKGDHCGDGGKEEMPARRDLLQGLTVERLRVMLREKGLSVKGKKDELISRLRSFNG